MKVKNTMPTSLIILKFDPWNDINFYPPVNSVLEKSFKANYISKQLFVYTMGFLNTLEV